METRLPVYKRILFLLILITSIALGIIFISPKFDGDILFGISAGLIASLILISLISPEIRENAKRFRENNNIYSSMKNFFTHPTQIPTIIGIIWFILIIFTIFLMSNFSPEILNQENDLLLIILFSPIFILIGWSGILMIKRKEMLDNFGNIYKGSWAVFVGILVTVSCWGGFIFMILAYIFNW